LKLYWHTLSLIPWRVRIALAEKAIEYEDVSVDVYSSPERSSEFLALNPFGQIPVLEDDGLVIAESLAILEYLEEKHPEPALMPEDIAARATVRQFMCWSTDYWPPAWKKWMAPHLPGLESTPESVAEGRREIGMQLDVLESQLADRDWLVDDFSLADVCYAPLVLLLESVGLEDDLAARAKVAAWAKRLTERPSVKATTVF
jgi:glutathione S-transferase